MYIGAGVYRGQRITLDTTGTSGNIISWIGDIDGSQTGDAGLVVITTEKPDGQFSLGQVVDMNGHEFQFFKNINFIGGTSACIYDSFQSGDRAYEEVTFEDCVFRSYGEDDSTVQLDFNGGATPTTAGLTFRRCVFVGAGAHFRYDENASAAIDLKMLVENCIFLGNPSEQLDTNYGFWWELGSASTHPCGGVLIQNCYFMGKDVAIGAEAITGTDPAEAVVARSNYFENCVTALYAEGGSGMVLSGGRNIFAAVTNEWDGVISADTDWNQRQPGMVGGIDDLNLYREFGWSPFRPFEPIVLDDGIEPLAHVSVGSTDVALSSAEDFYGESRPMGNRVGIRTEVFHFDASDEGPTDPDTVWTGDANAFDNDISTIASVTVAGTETTNELSAGGTNAPASGGPIIRVEARTFVGTLTGDSISVDFYEDGDLAGDALSGTSLAISGWSSWGNLNPPVAGWSWAAIQALEVAIFGNGSLTLGEIGAIQLRVVTDVTTEPDVGPIEARARPEQETTTVETGGNSIRFPGAGFHDILVPVGTDLVTIDVSGRFDSNHTGGKPKLEAFNIPGVADQSDIMTGAANQWEGLQVTFTPTSEGVVRIRLSTADTSVDGISFFDNLAVS